MPPARPPVRARGVDRALGLLVATLIAFYFARALVDCFVTPLKAHDAIGIWGLKAMAVYLDGGVRPEFFTLDRGSPMHPDYPLLQPLHGAWLLLNFGQPEERVLKAPFPLLWICLLVFLNGFLRRATGRRAAYALTGGFALMDAVYLHTLLVTADLPLAVFAFRAMIAWTRWETTGRAAELRLAGLLIAFAAATKNEGWAVAAGAVCLALLGRGARAGRLRIAAQVVATTLVLNLPWLLFRWRHGLYSDLLHGEFLFGRAPDAGPLPGPGRLPFLVARAAEAAELDVWHGLRRWDLFWVLIALLSPAVVATRKSMPPAARSVLVFVAVMGAGYLAALCISPHDIRWHATTALPRLLLQIAAPTGAGTALALAGFLNRPPARTIRSGPDRTAGPGVRP